MTPGTADRPLMPFEELERRAPETVRLEYINGKLEVKAMPDGNHTSIFMWLLRPVPDAAP